MTNTAAPAPAGCQTEVTYGPDAEIRIYEQTASRDYTAMIVPGTYPVQYTDVNYFPFVEGQGESRPYYARIEVLIDTPDRTQSSVEFGGVALAWENVKGERRTHTITMYAYQMTA